MSYTCAECGFDLWRYIAPTYSAHVGLYDDRRYPGRCLVVLPYHVDHFEDLEVQDSCHFMSDVTKVGRAIKKVTGATRINYALLGNAVSHVHCHVIPRFDDDPNPNSSPWSRNDKSKAMSKEKSELLIQQLREALNG